MFAGIVLAMLWAGPALAYSTTNTSTSTPYNECPAVGADSSCEVLFVINPDGSVTANADPSQGPYDGIEDTLIGVVNNSGQTVPSLTLTSTTAAFGFDGDGICSYGLCFSTTNTGYEGPDNTFTVTDADHGSVDFTAGGLPSGDSTYFSLEGNVTPGSLEFPLAAQPATVNATEGQSFSGTVATFTDSDASDPSDAAANDTATIDWGDGSTSTGTITSTGGGQYTVSGTHIYADEGSPAISVSISDPDDPGGPATTSGTATVADAALTGAAIAPSPVSGQSFSGPVATFADANTTTSSPADFTATIDWGDGTPTSMGTVTGSGGSYSVSGGHAYSGTGFYTVKTHIVDDGGSTADVTTTVLVYGLAKGGSFVISNKKDAVNTPVTFWGSQWAKANPLSVPAPSAFKGFEDQPKLPACGATWKTDPGNSTPPPAGPLPAYMAVIASSSIAGSPTNVISGNTVSLVVVKTNPGYGPMPSSAGTGTVVATIC